MPELPHGIGSMCTTFGVRWWRSARPKPVLDQPEKATETRIGSKKAIHSGSPLELPEAIPFQGRLRVRPATISHLTSPPIRRAMLRLVRLGDDVVDVPHVE